MRLLRFLGFALFLTACGGQTVDTSGDASTTGDAGKDVALVDTGLGLSCPSNVPVDGSSCSLASGFQCEYGQSFWAVCDVIATCQSGKWQLPPPNMGCPFVETGCPSSFASITNGGSCTQDMSTCAYPEGQCTCEGFCGGVMLPDAGNGSSWKCATPDPNCPWPRPRFGSACTGTASCQYDICCAGSQMQCTNGSWQGTTELAGCP